MTTVRSLRVVGLHPVVPSEWLFDKTLELQFGDDLTGDKLAEAKREVREHFKDLYFVEIEVDPVNAAIDWMKITQPVEGRPASEWQAPYDERLIDGKCGLWAIYFHFLNIRLPLISEVGPLELPKPTAWPPDLPDCDYLPPG